MKKSAKRAGFHSNGEKNGKSAGKMYCIAPKNVK
tara:strand:- start:18 stop:119 length:102 start_codon:yes stop_codon:yes gene_type:complete